MLSCHPVLHLRTRDTHALGRPSCVLVIYLTMPLEGIFRISLANSSTTAAISNKLKKKNKKNKTHRQPTHGHSRRAAEDAQLPSAQPPAPTCAPRELRGGRAPPSGREPHCSTPLQRWARRKQPPAAPPAAFAHWIGLKGQLAVSLLARAPLLPRAEFSVQSRFLQHEGSLS